MLNHTEQYEDTKFLISFLHRTYTDTQLLKVAGESRSGVVKLDINDGILADRDEIRAVSQYTADGERIFKIVPITPANKSIEVSISDIHDTRFVLYKNGISYDLNVDLDTKKSTEKPLNGVVYSESDILSSADLRIGDFTIDKETIKIKEINIDKDNFTVEIEPSDNINNRADIYVIFSQSDTNKTYISAGRYIKSDTYKFDLKDWLSGLCNEKSKFDIYLIGNRGDIVHPVSYHGKTQAGDGKLFGMLNTQEPDETNYTVYSRLWVSSEKRLVLKRDTMSNLLKEQFSLKPVATDISKKDKKYTIKMSVYSSSIKDIDIKDAFICLRNQDRLVSAPLHIGQVNKKGKKINLEVSINPENTQLEPNFWDIYIDISYKKVSMALAKVSVTDKLVSKKIYHKMTKYQSYLKNKHAFAPYITKGQELAFMYRPIDPLESRYYYFKENIAFFVYTLLAKQLRNKNIWIGFEKLAMSAHESGYYFFDYVHQNNLHGEFYYVIRKDSPELPNLKKYKEKILYYKSFKYFVYMFAAKLFISSDTRGNSYHIRVKNSRLGREVTKKPLVFLQHGYNGIKRVPDFHKARNVFDLVIAASEFERNIIVQDWGYSPNEVVNTGLARWDHLQDKEDQVDAKQIFVMPTWRTWMDGMSKEDFVKSEFYHKYIDFLSSDRLNKILDKNNVKIKFFLHPKFKSYIDLFKVESSNIETFGFLETPLDEMIMKSSMMISDYSSIIWEMFYLGKPCVFYHFDKDKYLEYEGSYMDFDKDLFGDAAFDVDSLVDVVESYIDTNFAEKDKYHKMRSKYLTYVDNENSKRIYDAVILNKDYLYGKSKPWKFSIRKIIPFNVKVMLSRIKGGL